MNQEHSVLKHYSFPSHNNFIKFNLFTFVFYLVVGIGGPVGSGKTALMLQLCIKLRETYNLCAVTNDIFTREDGEFLTKNNVNLSLMPFTLISS